VTEYGEDDLIYSGDFGLSGPLRGPSVWFHYSDYSGNQRVILINCTLDDSNHRKLQVYRDTSAGGYTKIGDYYQRDSWGTIIESQGRTYSGWLQWLTSDANGPGLSLDDFQLDFIPNLVQCQLREGLAWNSTTRAQAVSQTIPLLSVNAQP
jgi:hypothetical protein